MNRDGDVESVEARGARRAFAAISHELASPLTALQTYLKRASGDDIARIQQCVDRIRAIAELAREVSLHEDSAAPQSTDLVLAIESATARLSVTVAIVADGAQRARIAPARASTTVTALLRAVVAAATGTRFVARFEHDGDRICARITPDIEPTAWRVVDPWQSGTGFKLDLWAAAVTAGPEAVVRVGELDGQIAVELELPRVELR